MTPRPPRSRSLDLFRPVRRETQSSRSRPIIGTLLRKFGPSWQAAPIRRSIQAICLLIYLDLFFRVSWPYNPRFSSKLLSVKEWIPVEIFLWLDPLVGLSTGIAARGWNVALFAATVILLTGLVFPRGFCGYLCPLGSLIDLFDHLLGRRFAFQKIPPPPSWANARFYLLAAVLTAAVFGVLLSGFVAAIPVLTRGLLFSLGNAQLGLGKNWGMLPPFTAAVWFSLALFLVVFLFGLITPRFWCRYLCPSGALLSLPSMLRRFQRHVDDRCIRCGKCIEVCSFDAIQPDFSGRPLNCTFCQSCGGICPTEAIHFLPVPKSSSGTGVEVHLAQSLTRRAMLNSVAVGGLAAALTPFSAKAGRPPIRPPGSVPEKQFLDLCIRCEQCIKVCPGPVLQAAGWGHGLEALWTPVAVFPHAGCHQDCNFCTQVCPTGAIRPLSIAEKRRFAVGLAVVDPAVCLPYRGERDCQLCLDECNAAGYRAIEMQPIKLATGPVPEGAFSPDEIEQMGRILAPVVKVDACVGCGLCEYRCHSVWAGQHKLLKRSAVVVRAR